MRISSLLLAVPLTALAATLAFAAPTGPASRHPSGLVTVGGPDAILTMLDGARNAGSRHPSGLVTLTAQSETIGAAIVNKTGSRVGSQKLAASRSKKAPPQLSKPAGPGVSPQPQQSPVALVDTQMQDILCAASAVAAADIARSTGALDLVVVATHRDHYRRMAMGGERNSIKVGGITVTDFVDGMIAGTAGEMANVPVHVVMNQYAACALRYDEGN